MKQLLSIQNVSKKFISYGILQQVSDKRRDRRFANEEYIRILRKDT